MLHLAPFQCSTYGLLTRVSPWYVAPTAQASDRLIAATLRMPPVTEDA